MVATWNPAANSTYYSRQRETEYYAGPNEPAGYWHAPAGDFGLSHGAAVERETFERLYAAVGEDGKSVLEKIRRHVERVPAFDVTLSAPRSVSLAWAFASYETKQLIELAQQRAVSITLSMLEREATFARRGQRGVFVEKVPLTAATFQHGESRPAKHFDGHTFADPNLHTHCVLLNLATRADGTVGALHSNLIRDFKMAAGATYHAALARELQLIGFAIDRVARNGVFELVDVDENAIRYFSARRNEIELELAGHGVVSAQASALAAAVTKATRTSKPVNQTVRRQQVWADAARSNGIDVDTFTERLRDQERAFDWQAAERLFAERIAVLPAMLTEHESVIDRRELVRSIAAALVGTGLPVERADIEVDRLVSRAAVIEIGRDAIGLPRYSTLEMLSIERQVVEFAQGLARRPWLAAGQDDVTRRCRKAGLSAEQTQAVRSAANGSAIAIIEGAPGAGKTSTLAPLVDVYRGLGCRVIGTATAWRVATMLRDDLAIDARATASWIAKLKAGEKVFDNRTVLIADEAGLLSSREMHTLLGAAAKADAKLVLVGDRRQLQAIGAGPGLDLVARAVEAARVDTIMRQKEPWARKAVADFGQGRSAAALQAFADRGFLIEAKGAKAAIIAIVDQAEKAQAENPNGSVLILGRTNATVAAISQEVRERRKAAGLIKGKEVTFTVATPSGHAINIRLAAGDQIRFLTRDDRLGVINGSTATISRVRQTWSLTSNAGVRIEADIGGRRVVFDPMILADTEGRPRIGWAYASTIAGSQGLTVDRAIVWIDPTFSRHDIYVASSRARDETILVVDAEGIDRRLTAELPIDRQRDDLVFPGDRRRVWLAERLSRASPKVSTLDVIEANEARDLHAERVRQHERDELGHEL